MLRLPFILLFIASFIGLSAQNNGSAMQTEKILFVLSSAHTYGDTYKDNSNHFSEIILPFDEFAKAGFTVDFVSPEGGAVPIGYIMTSNPTHKRYLYDANFMNLLKHTYRPTQIDPTEYKAIFYVGGGAAMFGVHDNVEIQRLAMHIYENEGGIVSAICHGTAGIVDLKTKDGKYLVAGKTINGFPDLFEDKKADYYQTFPFSIEERIRKNGGKFEFSEEGWDGYTTVDGRVLTGQDPTSGRKLATLIIETLRPKN